MPTLTKLTAPSRTSHAGQEYHCFKMDGRQRVRGFTLVESLFAIAFIALMVPLLDARVHYAQLASVRVTIEDDLRGLADWFQDTKQKTNKFPESLDDFPRDAIKHIEFRDGAIKDKSYNYCFRLLELTDFHFVIEARPCDGGGDGTVVYCVDETHAETRQVVTCGTDEGAVQDQEVRDLTVKLLAFKSIHHVIASSDEVDLAREIRSFVALEETRDLVFDVMDGNQDGQIAQGELLAFGQPREDDPPSIAIARQFLRESSSILRLDVGQYDGIRREDLEGEPADLLSPSTLADFVRVSASRPGVAHALNQKLLTAELAEARDDFESGAGAIRAFKNQLRAQRGKSLTFEDADVARTMVDVVFPNLVFGE
jgi:hypothetical protein